MAPLLPLEGTHLWKRTLASQLDDPNSAYRDQLRIALLGMRENVIPLCRQILHDVPGLTVHDESHLDALWQTASTIAGDEFALNPAEAFVFGASVLLHDTAMAIAAYPGGLKEIGETIVWRDAAAAETRMSDAVPAPEDLQRKNPELFQRVLFNVLRLLHASQAEKLIEITFSRPGRSEKLPLLSETLLRDAYGDSIGKIAHSHHWNAESLADHLSPAKGGAPGHPAEWTLNEVKIACLLRCADAAHIDSRRAPTFLFSIAHPRGVSANHWEFQNKLNQVTLDKDKLVFTTGQPFNISEANSWWLAYDTLKMIDKELRSCNAILSDMQCGEFAARSVSGVESPKLLSRHLRISEWTPVDAEVHVSDPVNLARTLGGRNLYGQGAFAPIRELLQNAVDAVRARRLQDGREKLWGAVKLTLEELPDRSQWLHVDDNGVGMSERVLTGPLIDFGKSLWSSTLLEEEFPGLRSRRPHPIGKFGIGFFAVFLLGAMVNVISRKYTEGLSATRVLAFDDLARRPLMRAARNGELPTDFTTRVSVKLDKNLTFGRQKNAEQTYGFGGLFGEIIKLIAGVDVDIEIVDMIVNRTHLHRADWINSPPTEFLREILADRSNDEQEITIALHEDLLTVIRDREGNAQGRAAVSLQDTNIQRAAPLISVGGFLYHGLGLDRYSSEYESSFYGIRHSRFYVSRSWRMLGVVEGSTDDASRLSALSNLSDDTIANWATNQAAKIEAKQLSKDKLVDVCHSLMRLGGNSGGLPFGYLDGRFRSVGEFSSVLTQHEDLVLPLRIQDYKKQFSFVAVPYLTTPYFTNPTIPNLAVVHCREEEFDFLTEEQRKEIVATEAMTQADLSNLYDDEELTPLIQVCRSVWNTKPSFKFQYRQIYLPQLIGAPSARLCLVISKR